ncbi:hypothetical protein [Parashewanella tropica]|uniref:hypothetical protein n=1 Tax=Parashewanella tropica TaxID=2547970 RepID=UPI00105A77C8|nr:hypothetical protein [Parashewanella tropica]
MFIAFLKKASLLSFLILSVGCTSLQVEKSIDALGDGVSDSVESRNENKPSHEQNYNPHSDDLISGVANMVFQGIISLFSSEKN